MPQIAASDRQFLKQLQKHAELQSHLSMTRILPERADRLTTLVGNHPWQTLVMLATFSTIVMHFIRKI